MAASGGAAIVRAIAGPVRERLVRFEVHDGDDLDLAMRLAVLRKARHPERNVTGSALHFNACFNFSFVQIYEI